MKKRRRSGGERENQGCGARLRREAKKEDGNEAREFNKSQTPIYSRVHGKGGGRYLTYVIWIKKGIGSKGYSWGKTRSYCWATVLQDPRPTSPQGVKTLFGGYRPEKKKKKKKKTVEPGMVREGHGE